MAQMVKNLRGNAGDPGLIPGSGRSPGQRNGNSVQYSYLENSMERGAWWATVHGVTESDPTEQLTLSEKGFIKPKQRNIYEKYKADEVKQIIILNTENSKCRHMVELR